MLWIGPVGTESREGPWEVYLVFCKVNFKTLANKLVEASTR